VAINMFEGARRIALAVGATWTLGCVAYSALQEPRAELVFSIASLGAVPEPAEHCGDEDARQYISRDFAPGRAISVTLCFTAHRANDGRMLVPYELAVDVELPDGRVVQNVPPTLAQTELLARLKANGIDVSRLTDTSGRGWEPVWRTYWRMDGRYSSVVSAYTQRIADGFNLPQPSRDAAASKVWDSRVQQWREVFQVWMLGLLFGWALTAIIGWIARGFLGIPRGMDKRLDS
jgi:hypothetical protein